MDEGTGVVLIFTSLFVLAAWFFWLDAKRRQALVQARSDLQNRLLEKFSSPQEVAQFLQTEGGDRFLRGLTTDSRHAGRGILRAMQIGVVITLVGAAVLTLGFVYPTERGANPGVIIGSLILALGVGFLISAAMSYVLSKKWGMLETEGRWSKES